MRWKMRLIFGRFERPACATGWAFHTRRARFLKLPAGHSNHTTDITDIVTHSISIIIAHPDSVAIERASVMSQHLCIILSLSHLIHQPLHSKPNSRCHSGGLQLVSTHLLFAHVLGVL